MIPVHRGRGGWGNSMCALGRTAAVVMLAAMVALAAGCSSQQKKPANEPGAGGANSGMGENPVGPGGGSLPNFAQTGTVGKGKGPLRDIHFGFNE
ncbi:MAG: hypothetical protein ACREQN_02770 [Candidatus Binataceae bacterium]